MAQVEVNKSFKYKNMNMQAYYEPNFLQLTGNVDLPYVTV